MGSRGQTLPQGIVCVNHRIDLSPEPSLHPPEGIRQLAKFNLTDNDKIDITGRPHFATSRGSEDVGSVNLVGKRRERGSQHRVNTHRTLD